MIRKKHCSKCKSRFNSRSHTGSDLSRIAVVVYDNGFNSRSHVGSDFSQNILKIRTSSFNSRSHVGSDSIRIQQFIKQKRFQHTLPRKERLNPKTVNSGWHQFQLTVPCRERYELTHEENQKLVFQFTLP